MTKPPGTYSKFPGIVSKREPIDSADYCEWCRRAIGPKEVLAEWGKLYVCSTCLERWRDTDEERARRDEYSDRVIRGNNDRKSR